jgi:hypothetical protein
MEGTVRTELLAQISRRGIQAEIVSDGSDEALVLPGNKGFRLRTLFAGAADVRPSDWPELVSDWLDGAVAAAERIEPEDMEEAELRQRIRTRLIRSLGGGLDGFGYARKPLGLTGQILCIDYDEVVMNLTEERIPDLRLSLDELFVQGQKNTDAEPVDPPVRLDPDAGIMEIIGESMFIASKATNMAALVPAVTGPAPHGLVFAIPRSSALIYQPIQDGWGSAVGEFANLAVALGTEALKTDEMVSFAAYYWAPDGTVEMLAAPTVDRAGKKSIVVQPDEAFSRYVIKGDLRP